MRNTFCKLLITLVFLNSLCTSKIYAQESLSASTASVISNESKAEAIALQADSLYWQNKYTEALNLFEKLANCQFANESSRIHWLSSVADCYCRMNNYQQAQSIYQQILDIYKKNPDEQSSNIAKTLIDLAACDFYLHNYSKAEGLCKRALVLLEKSHSTVTLILGKAHLALAETLYQQSKYTESAKEYSIAVKYYDQLYSLSRTDIIEPLMVALEGEGASYCNIKKCGQAKIIYERLANLERNAFGDKDIRYGWTLVTISNIDRRFGLDKDSAALYEKSVWIFRNANKNRLLEEYKAQGKLTAEIAKNIELRTYGSSNQNAAMKADNFLNFSDSYDDSPLICKPRDRSFPKPGPWNLVTTQELDPPGWVWTDPTKPLKGIIICVHGLGLNAHSYNGFANEVIGSGYTVIAFHVRGFGSYVSSKGGDKVNFQECLDDLSTVIKAIRKDYSDYPLYLLGESMGGAIALQLTSLYPELISGLICAVPAGNRYKTPSTDLEVALHIVKGINKPFDIGTKIVGQATTEASSRREWQSDPFNRLSLSPSELLQFASFMSHNKTAASKIKNTPVIVFQGVQDKLVKPKGTLEIYNSIGSKDKDLVLVGSSEHLIFENNSCPPSVISGVLGWIQAHNKNYTSNSIK